jgi:hypothetical protein
VRELPHRRLLRARLIGAGAAAPAQPQGDGLGADAHDDDVPGFPGSAGVDPDSGDQ